MSGPDSIMLINILRNVADSRQFILGSRCAELEVQLKKTYGYNHAVVASSFHMGLFLSLTALGQTHGDLVFMGPGAPLFARGIIHRCGAVATSHETEPAGVAVLGGSRHGETRVVWDMETNRDILIVDLGPTSPFNGVGDACAMFTHEVDVDQSLRILRNHGQDGHTRFLHHVVGFNSRMDEVCAAYLLDRPHGVGASVDRAL